MLKHTLFIFGLIIGGTGGIFVYPYLFSTNVDEQKAVDYTYVETPKADASFYPSIQTLKMDVLYIGLDNPIIISAPGVASTDLVVKAKNKSLRIESRGSGKFSVFPSRLGQVEIIVSNGDEEVIFSFRSKRIPNPKPKIISLEEFQVTAGLFKASTGMISELDNFDYDFRCSISGFTMVHIPKNGSKEEYTNIGPKYSEEVKQAVSSAKSGDHFIFHTIKCKCPGDVAGRALGSIAYGIK